MTRTAVVDWLLEPSDPSVRYRTLVGLLGQDPSSPDAVEGRRAIAGSRPVQDILGRMHPDGYWLQTNPRTGITVGDGVVYGAYASTHFCLAYLAELGLDRSHPMVRKAADRYLSLQAADGDFWNHFSCLNGYNIRTYTMLGYGGDPRLEKTIDLMLATRRHDGGYLCDMHEKRRPRAKSCIRGSVKMLMAYAMLPELWAHERCRELVDYFLRRDCIFRQGHPGTHVRTDITRTVFPITWQAGSLEVLWALARMGLGSHPATAAAWEALEANKAGDGRYILDWTPTQVPFHVGRRGQPNKWITFYALQAQKLRDGAAVDRDGAAVEREGTERKPGRSCGLAIGGGTPQDRHSHRWQSRPRLWPAGQAVASQKGGVYQCCPRTARTV